MIVQFVCMYANDMCISFKIYSGNNKCCNAPTYQFMNNMNYNDKKSRKVWCVQKRKKN